MESPRSADIDPRREHIVTAIVRYGGVANESKYRRHLERLPVIMLKARLKIMETQTAMPFSGGTKMEALNRDRMLRV